MSIEAMKQALEALEMLARYENPETRIQVRKPKDGGPIVTMYPHKVAFDAAAAIRAAIEQAEKPVAWQVMVEDEAMKEFPIKDMAHDWCVHQKLSGSPYSYWIRPLYTNPPAAPRQEQYDQTALELCEECGWKAIIPGEGCLVCARQKAKPVAWRWKEVKGEFVGAWMLTVIEPPPYVTESMPLYPGPHQWVGLTEIEICDIEVDELPSASCETFSFARAIEEKLKEKNNAG
jgi:hypothetical protein